VPGRHAFQSAAPAPPLRGYIFIHFCYRFYFRAQALDGHRLIFEAAVAGFVLFLPCRWVVFLLFHHAVGLRELWYGLAGRTPFLSTLVLTLVSSPFVAFVWNLCEGIHAWPREEDWERGGEGPSLSTVLARGRERALSWAVKRWGNALQSLLHEAAKRTLSDYTWFASR
jgi:hypothetical protein